MTKPDLEFIRELKRSGGENLKKCYQCATCSVVCKLSPDVKPYPRKEMIWAQWGQKDKLATDPDIWLCHQCNDCSTNCPRGARPGDVLASLRKNAVEHYAFPSFMGKIVGNPNMILLALGIPAILVLLASYVGNSGFVWAPEHGEIHFSDFMSHMWLNIFFSFFVTMGFASGLLGVARFWKDMKIHRPSPAKEGIIGAAMGTFIELMLHGRFSQCGEAKTRKWAHMMIFYGFAGLFIVTGIVVIMLVLDPDSYPINSLAHPMKIAGNAFGVILILGSLTAIYNRLTNEEEAGNSSYFDWYFLMLVFGVGVTGMATEITRFADMKSIAYPTYYIHLVNIYALLVFLPYSKFAHMLYRFTALTYARHIGLYAANPEKVAAQAVAASAPAEKSEETSEENSEEESGQEDEKSE
jgi:quinone-modifying oxidoreductase subunit QmoC